MTAIDDAVAVIVNAARDDVLSAEQVSLLDSALSDWAWKRTGELVAPEPDSYADFDAAALFLWPLLEAGLGDCSYSSDGIAEAQLWRGWERVQPDAAELLRSHGWVQCGPPWHRVDGFLVPVPADQIDRWSWRPGGAR